MDRLHERLCSNKNMSSANDSLKNTSLKNKIVSYNLKMTILWNDLRQGDSNANFNTSSW